ncbi:MAG: hypothetical protein ACI9MB_004740 [Verrucomicrobiales bacterium]
MQALLKKEEIIATDDSVQMSAHINQRLEQNSSKNKTALREEIVQATKLRSRPGMVHACVTVFTVPNLSNWTESKKLSDIAAPENICPRPPCYGRFAILKYSLRILSKNTAIY